MNPKQIASNYVFFEGHADGFDETKLDFSDIYWQTGIAIDFY